MTTINSDYDLYHKMCVYHLNMPKNLATSLEIDPGILHAIFETAIDCIIIIDERGTIQLVNESTTKLFGYDRSELVGQNVRMMMPEHHAVQHDQYLKNYHETRHPKIIGIGRDEKGRRKDGSLSRCGSQ